MEGSGSAQGNDPPSYYLKTYSIFDVTFQLDAAAQFALTGSLFVPHGPSPVLGSSQVFLTSVDPTGIVNLYRNADPRPDPAPRRPRLTRRGSYRLR